VVTTLRHFLEDRRRGVFSTHRYSLESH
jgi:hypothetical protein